MGRKARRSVPQRVRGNPRQTGLGGRSGKASMSCCLRLPGVSWSVASGCGATSHTGPNASLASGAARSLMRSSRPSLACAYPGPDGPTTLQQCGDLPQDERVALDRRRMMSLLVPDVSPDGRCGRGCGKAIHPVPKFLNLNVESSGDLCAGWASAGQCHSNLYGLRTADEAYNFTTKV